MLRLRAHLDVSHRSLEVEGLTAQTWTRGGIATPSADLWPLTLGICRDCEACRLKLKTTLDGSMVEPLYWCRVTMHETDGTDRCGDYRPRPEN